jgi:hypothetical protein
MHVEAAPFCVPRKVMAWATQWTADGVPLSCDARVSFDDEFKRVLVFDSSFVSGFRQRYEIVVLGAGSIGDKMLTCDDFVIPRRPTSAEFQIESIASCGPTLADAHTRVLSLQETVSTADCVQEAEMFNEFARVAARREGGNVDADAKWRTASLVTQAVCDACMASLRANGAVVEVVQP